MFGGTGDDFILGSRTTERILGNEGSDWIESGTFDGAPGDNFDEIFARDAILGHDVFLGDGSTDEFIGEGGDDIFVGSAGINKLEGMSGFDWATYKDHPATRPHGVYADLTAQRLRRVPAAAGPVGAGPVRQRRGAVGIGLQRHPARLGRDRRRHADRRQLPDRQQPHRQHPVGRRDRADRRAGCPAPERRAKRGDGGFDGGNIILGGAGSDRINGRGGDDVIDGDKWLDVRIARANADGTKAETSSTTA